RHRAPGGAEPALLRRVRAAGRLHCAARGASVRLWLICAALVSCQAARVRVDGDTRLRFSRGGRTIAEGTERELEAAAPPGEFTAYDPYYGHPKRWRALPMRAVLARGFAGVALAEAELLLRARDGYAVPLLGAQLLDDGCYLAVADLDAPEWEPIGPQRAD